MWIKFDNAKVFRNFKNIVLKYEGSKLIPKMKESEEGSLEVKPPWSGAMELISSWEGILRADLK